MVSLLLEIPVHHLISGQKLNRGLVFGKLGTGCFMLYNTGTDIVQSTHGLVTTVGYKMGADKPLHYALEGSMAVGGSSVSWLVISFSLPQSLLRGSIPFHHCELGFGTTSVSSITRKRLENSQNRSMIREESISLLVSVVSSHPTGTCERRMSQLYLTVRTEPSLIK